MADPVAASEKQSEVATLSHVTELASLCQTYRTRATELTDLLRDLRSLMDQDVKKHVPIDLSSSKLERVEADMYRFRRADCNPRYTIAFAGGFNAGKSHLINAILGETLLPKNLAETTFIPTVIRQSESGEREATVRYLTTPEIAEIFDYYRGVAKEHPWPSTVRDAELVPGDVLGRLVESLPTSRERDDVTRLFQALKDQDLSAKIKEGDAAERRLDFGELEQLIVRNSDRLERYIASSVTIGLPNFPLGADVEIIDLPGTDAADPWARKLTLRYIKDVDAMIVVAPCDKVFGEPGSELLQSAAEWGGLHVERLFFVVNKADKYAGQPAPEILDAFNWFRSRVNEYFSFGDVPRIYYTAAIAALKPDEETLRDLERIPRTENERLDGLLDHARQRGGVDHLVEQLQQFLRNEASTVKIASLRERWSAIVDGVGPGIRAAADRAQGGLSTGRQRLAEKYADELEAIRKTVQNGVRALRRDVNRIGQSLSLTAEHRENLRQKASLICHTPVDDDRKHEDAGEMARERWDEIQREFAASALNIVRTDVLGAFLDQSRRLLKEPLQRLARLRIHDEIPDFQPCAEEPSAAILESIEFRLGECLARMCEDAPYRAAPRAATFEAFEAQFQKDVLDVLSGRCVRDLLLEVSEFLPYYLGRHVEKCGHRVDAFVAAIIDQGLASRLPEHFHSLTENDDTQRAEEMMRKVCELGKRFELIVGP